MADDQNISDSLAALKRFLRDHSAHIAYAHIRAGRQLGRTTAPTILAYGERWPRFSYWSPQLAATDAPDVFGIQLLGPGHREVKPSPNWMIEALPENRRLLEHVEPQRWFGPLNLEQALEHQLSEEMLLKLFLLPGDGAKRVALVLEDGRILENIQISYFGAVDFPNVPPEHRDFTAGQVVDILARR